MWIKEFPTNNNKGKCFHKMTFALESWLSGVHSMSWYADQDHIKLTACDIQNNPDPEIAFFT